jgi:IS30 family transposase
MTVFEKAKCAHDKMVKSREPDRVWKRQRMKDEFVRGYVVAKLCKEHWSPEEISERLTIDHPEKGISFKTIYNFVKHERRDLQKYLTERGTPRRQRVCHRRGRIRQGAPTKRSIHERPEEVNQRIEVGHWEGDLVVSKRGENAAVLSLTERVNRKKLFRLIPNHQAATVLSVLRAVLEQLPPELRKSLTLDNGPEFSYSELKVLEEKYPGLKIYFCDPYAAWQKGGVENSNKDLRWYYPKGTDFSEVTKEALAEVEQRLGNRPLKCLKYRTPDECFPALKKAA